MRPLAYAQPVGAGGPRPPTPTARAVLALTLKEAILRGIENNPDLAVERVSLDIARAAVEVQRGVFDPVAFSDGNYVRTRGPFFAVNPFGGTVNPITGLPSGLIVNPTSFAHFGAGLRTQTVLGTAFELRYDMDRRTTDNAFGLSPAYTPGATAIVTQPLLRGLGIDVNRAFIEIAMNDRRSIDAAFRDAVLATALAVEEAYWLFVFSRENQKVAEAALGTAKDLLDINKRKFAVGRVAEIEVLVAETGVATREEAVIVARNEFENARDGLFRLILPLRPAVPRDAPPARRRAAAARTGAWDLDLIALDLPRPDDRLPDPEDAFTMALRNRPDYRQFELALASDDIRIERAESEWLPRLDATGSWTQLGLGKSWGGSTETQTDGDYYEWQVGFAFEIPIFNTTARAQLRQAELGKLQTRRRLESLEQLIIFEVRTATRNIVASRERVRATDVARRLAEEQLGNEKKRLEVGLATNYDVLLFEQDLTAARTNYLRAQVDRAIARARLERATGTILDRFDVRIRDEP